jgi:hypothetical protein
MNKYISEVLGSGMTDYLTALKEYNKDSDYFIIPRTGTKKYYEIKEIEKKISNKKPKNKKATSLTKQEQKLIDLGFKLKEQELKESQNDIIIDQSVARTDPKGKLRSEVEEDIDDFIPRFSKLKI